MTLSSGDPLPSIAEAEATAEIAELYADIRGTLGMPFVNLVWRGITFTIPQRQYAGKLGPVDHVNQ